ncbi:amidase [uncultured Jannaschia sp.]|uniref:amidase n=1 Tax=uncultured Jannaschia sp. TaxID=293347 RepID=UPI0026357B60|nr:amidase [uncultured Jannaschia sp.]
MTHPADVPLSEIAHDLRAGRLSAVELTRAHLDRIAIRDGAICAFVHLAAEDALSAAARADAAFADGRDLGPLHGIPFAVKDLIDVGGWPVRGGSRLYAHRIAARTAPVLGRLLAGGAVPLGLVATYELATVGPDPGALYPQPRNPRATDRLTGGSSSGSAAAVAAGMVRLALGTDTGGSVRSPAAYCGVTGLKPTFGALSTEGVLPLSPSLDHVGILATTVADAAHAWRALGGSATGTIRGRIGYVRDWAGDAADLLALLDDAARGLAKAGHPVDVVALPDYAAIEEAGLVLIQTEQLAIHGAALRDHPERFGPMARDTLGSGYALDANAVAAARACATGTRRAVDAALDGHVALILPTTMAPAPRFADFAASGVVWTAMRTIPFNMTGHPAITVPMGKVDGMPMGLQIVGRHGDEATILALASAFETAGRAAG